MFKTLIFACIFALIPISSQALTLAPNNSIGSVQIKEYTTKPTELQIGTGSGSRAASSLGDWLVGDRSFLKPYGTEGSIALFNLTPGVYQLEWQFYTAETDGDDVFLLWNGIGLSELARSSIATIKASATYKQSDWLKTKVNTSGIVGLIALDTTDKLNSSTWKIRSIERVPEPTICPFLLLLFLVGKSRWVKSKI